MLEQALTILEAQMRLARWDLFMRRHSFAELYGAIRTVPIASRSGTPVCADRLYQAVEIACALYPKQVLCLQRSCVLARMLRSRGVPAQLTIGSQRKPFRAHAWVTVNGEVLGDKLAQRETFLIMEVC